MKPLLSVVITNYNEKENIERGVLQEMYDYLAKAKYDWEVIINDDGSSDGGDILISDFVDKHKGFRLIHGKHGGKAAGLWNGLQQINGEVVLFTDMDQSTPLKEVEKLLPWFQKGYQIVFGSRGKMRKNFPITRQITSWGFRFVRGIFLLHDVVDTQCGFKAMTADSALRIFPMLSVIKNKKKSKAKGWSVSAYDVEMLFIAEKLNYKLKEVDVIWKNEDTSTSKAKNFLTESTDMLKQIFQVKINDILGKYDKK